MGMRIGEALHEWEHNQEIGVYALTPNGKQATKDTASVVREAVTRFSDRLAGDANTFTDGLKADLEQLQALSARAQEVIRRMESGEELDNSAVDEFFAIESETNLLARKIVDKEARIDAMLADLDDPVSALDRLEAKYPTVRRPYLAAFGR